MLNGNLFSNANQTYVSMIYLHLVANKGAKQMLFQVSGHESFVTANRFYLGRWLFFKLPLLLSTRFAYFILCFTLSFSLAQEHLHLQLVVRWLADAQRSHITRQLFPLMLQQGIRSISGKERKARNQRRYY